MRKTQTILKQLRDYESRNIMFIQPDGSWPIVWERARGVHVWDVDGKKYLDLTAAFGVAAAGHANPRVVRAGREQMGRLLHAMGDVHPHALKAQLARELSRITFERWAKRLNRSTVQRFNDSTARHGKVIFCNSGFEAVEAALKTAVLATGRPGVIAFEGAYHGLGYGALNATHRDFFRAPFHTQLRQFGHFLPFPSAADSGALVSKRQNTDRRMRVAGCSGTAGKASLGEIAAAAKRLFGREKIGAILVEPVQGRGGINVPPPEFLPLLRRLCDENGALLIADEIFTGFGRTGKWFACEHSGVVPDVICLGKAMAGGFPISACVGRADLMDAAWPPSQGEAIHTSTFLGHPVGCAMALAQIGELRRLRLPERSARLGEFLLHQLQSLRSRISNSRLQIHVRGLGLMVGVEMRRHDGSPATDEAMRVIRAMLRCGFILLPEGEHSNVLGFTPPLTIAKTQLMRAVDALEKALNGCTVESLNQATVQRFDK